jgi:hypothetical protein
MKHFNLALIISSFLLMTGCGSGSDSGNGSGGSSISVTIDGQAYTFSGCGAVLTGGYENDIGCTYQSGGEAKRIRLANARDINGGEVMVTLTDVPDATKLDSPYGIEYTCNNLGSPACSTAEVPTFDATTTTFTLTDVVIALTYNRTDALGDPIVPGPSDHTVSVTVDASTIAAFQ